LAFTSLPSDTLSIPNQQNQITQFNLQNLPMRQITSNGYLLTTPELIPKLTVLNIQKEKRKTRKKPTSSTSQNVFLQQNQLIDNRTLHYNPQTLHVHMENIPCPSPTPPHQSNTNRQMTLSELMLRNMAKSLKLTQ